jgi:hypothetical protein
MSEPIPYREGEPAPSPRHMRARLTDETDGSVQDVWVDPSDLKQPPLRHDEVNVLLPVIRWQWRHIGQYLTWCRSFEDWELGFLRDTHPGSEVAVWCRLTYAFLEFTQRNPGFDRSLIYNSVVAVSNGRADKVRPRSVAEKLEKLIANAPSSLGDVGNFTEDGICQVGPSHLR